MLLHGHRFVSSLADCIWMFRVFQLLARYMGFCASMGGRFYSLKSKNACKNPFSWFPHGLENLENGKTFSSQGILNRLEKWGDLTPNTGKVREF